MQKNTYQFLEISKENIFQNISTFSAAFCVLRLVSFKSPSPSMQSNNYFFLNLIISTNQEIGLAF